MQKRCGLVKMVFGGQVAEIQAPAALDFLYHMLMKDTLLSWLRRQIMAVTILQLLGAGLIIPYQLDLVIFKDN
jgi:hypothetical protein